MVGKDFHRYRLLKEPRMYLSYGKWLAEPRENAPFFDEQKIVLRQTADSLIGYLDDKKRVNLNNVYNVGTADQQFDLCYILALLNSKFLNFLYQNVSQEKGRTFAEVKKNYLEKLPIADIPPSDQKPFVELVKNISSINDQLFISSNHFQKLLVSEFNIKAFPARLNSWWLVEFTDFVKSLGIELSLQKKDELLQLFEKYRSEAVLLDQQIKSIIRQIDDLVYRTYDLTPEEIKTVEGS